MKPLTADNNDGRVLLALRAGAMTTGEFSERGLSVSGWLIKEGLVDPVDGGYRITEAGRSACPLRNPLAATVAPAIHSPEVFTMPKGETRITRDQVLAAIKEAGCAGINRKQLLERFVCSESNMDNHLMNLAKMHAIFRPKPGHCVAAGLVYDGAAEPAAKPAAQADLIPEIPAESPVVEPVAEPDEIEVEIEQIEVTAVGDRRGPIVINDAADLDIGMFSSGRLEISVGRDTVVIEPAAMKKLRGFLGLFQEAA